MSRDHRELVGCWLALLALGAIEFGMTWLPFLPSYRPLLLLPAFVMVALVGLMFMGARVSATIARGFAIAALFWLAVLPGLGMVDPLTRATHFVNNVSITVKPQGALM
jgi:hypothetical protein